MFRSRRSSETSESNRSGAKIRLPRTLKFCWDFLFFLGGAEHWVVFDINLTHTKNELRSTLATMKKIENDSKRSKKIEQIANKSTKMLVKKVGSGPIDFCLTSFFDFLKLSELTIFLTLTFGTDYYVDFLLMFYKALPFHDGQRPTRSLLRCSGEPPPLPQAAVHHRGHSSVWAETNAVCSKQGQKWP